MPVRRVVANDQVAADRGRVALAARADRLRRRVARQSRTARCAISCCPTRRTLDDRNFAPDLLNGVQVVKATGVGLAFDARRRGPERAEQQFIAIPYSTWANRGRGQMAVWLARTEAAARPTPYPTLATTSVVTTSGRKDTRGINDGEEPASSNDSASYFDWWPAKGTTEWIGVRVCKARDRF